MLDGRLRRIIDPVVIDPLARRLAARGVGADTVTWAGALLGLAAALVIAWAGPAVVALVLLLLSRLADGVDGALARAAGQASAAGGLLDIVLDFAFYGLIPLAFALRAPETNALPAAILLFAFYVNGASFLAFAAIAARHGVDPQLRGPKALVFSTGLAEASETLLVFVAMVLWPTAFPWLALGFAGLCLLTAALRLHLGLRSFR